MKRKLVLWGFALTSMLFQPSNALAEEPWFKWQRNPLTIPVTVVATNLFADTNTPVTVSLSDGTRTWNGAGCDTETNAAGFAANLRVRKECLLTVVASNLTSTKLLLNYKANWTPPSRTRHASRPKEYRLLVDGLVNPYHIITISNTNDCQYYSNSWVIELNERLPAHWRLEDGSNDPKPAPGDGERLELGPGKSLDKSRAALNWSVSLGRLLDGTAAGRLTVREPTLTSEIYTRSNLYYTAGSEIVRDQVSLITETTNSPVLRQVKVLQTFVDLVALTNSTELRFYQPSQVGSGTNASGHYTNITGNPFVVWALVNTNAPNTNTLDIVERRNGVNATNQIIYDANSTTATWTLRCGQGGEQRVETRGVTFTSSPTTNRIETVDIRYAGASTPAYHATENYRLYPWGFELVETRIDPDNNPGTANDLVTSFDFYEDPGDPITYSNPRLIFQPDGYWEKRVYDQDLFVGALQYALHPDRDLPSNPTNAVTGDSIADAYVYDEEYARIGTFRGITTYDKNPDPTYSATNKCRINLMVRGNVGVGVNINDDGLSIPHMQEDLFPGGGPTADGGGLFGNLAYTPDETLGFGYYGHDFWSWNRTKPEPVRSYYYHAGSYNPTNYTFTTNGLSPGEGPDWRQCIVETGWPDAYDADDPYPVESVGWAEGASLYYGNFFPYRSSREAFIYQNGSLVQREKHIFTGGDEFGEAQFDLVGRWVYQNDSLGHATNILWLDGGSSVSRVVYSADYRGPNTYDGELLLWEMDELGVKTVYAYDSLKRLVSLTKVGVAAAGGFSSQPDIITSVTNDAYHRPLSATVSASGLNYSTSTVYDLAGRVTSQTDTNGLTTTLAYDLGGRKTTKTLPSGLTEIRENYLDRRLKSVTGTGVVPEFHNWEFVDENTRAAVPLMHRVVTMHSIQLGNTNSTRIIKEGIDWVGRIIRRETPDWINTNAVVEYTGYFSYQLAVPNALYRSLRGANVPSTVSYLDFAGAANFQSVPIESYYSGWVEPASLNRLTKSYWAYAKVGGHWFKCTTNLTYRADNDATAVLVSRTQERLNGFASGNTLSEVTTWDADTNATVVTVTVDRAAKKITQVTDTPQSTLNATNIAINGLAQWESTPTVASPTRHYYDALGRQTSIVSPLGHTATSAYNTYGQVTSVMDFTGLTTAYDYYVNGQVGAGQVKSVTTAARKTCTAYTNFGVWRVWGDVPYPEERLYSEYGELAGLHTYRGGSGWNSASWPASPGTADQTTWTYQEASGLLASKTDNSSQSVSYTYTNGLLHTRTWARGIVTTNYYNTLGELLRTDYSDGTASVVFTNTAVTSYNRSGQPSLAADASGTWRFEYDPASRLTAAVCTNGLMNGVTVSNRFDGLNGRDQIQVLGTSPTLTHDYRYDGYGRLGVVSNGVYSANYGYLANADLLQTTTCKSNTTTVLTTSRSWEYEMRLGAILNQAGTTMVSSHSYQYDSLNRRTRASLEDGSYWQYDYNDRNELTGARRYWPDMNPVSGQHFGYGYDNIGNRQSATFGGDVNGGNLNTIGYTANSLNQYTGITTPSYREILGVALATNSVTVNGGTTDRKVEYFHREIATTNGSGPVWQNVITASGGTTNTGGLVLPSSSQTLTYDSDGNLSFDGVWSYLWDAENRLGSMNMTNVAGIANSNRLRLDFVYDCLGRRVQKVVSTNSTGSTFVPQSTNRFVYDGWNLLAILSPNSQLLSSYTWGQDLSGTINNAGGIGGLLLVTSHSSPVTNCFVGYDGNGNVTALVNASDQSVSARYEYSGYGELLRSTGPLAMVNPFRWSTKFGDEESGLVYYGYRYFSPTQGRWLGRDPIEEDGGFNLYGFVANNPTLRVDLLGNMEFDETQSILTALRGGITDAVKVRYFPLGPLGMALNAGVDGVMYEWFHSGGIYDFKTKQDRRPPKERFETGVGSLRADEFGNYLAGYAAGYAAFKTGDMSYISKTLGAGLAIGAYDEWQGTGFSIVRYFEDRCGQISMNYNGMHGGINDFLDE